ncbi:MAG: adenylate/guanylate cyclase domain-containing protein [Desulfobaccales bacterium]|nr:adenylate/guanylate cyclase domain-containing protein [Desulfobaccales bacterium]
MKNRSLATKLIILILSGTAIIFLAVFTYNYRASTQGMEDEAAENARNLTRATAYKIEVVLHGAEKIPRSLARTIEQHPLVRPELCQLIQVMVGDNPELFGVCVAFQPYAFDLKKYYFAPYASRHDGGIKLEILGSDSYRYFGTDWYQIPQELGRPIWSEPYYDEGGGNIIMSTFSVPFYRKVSGGKKFRGVVTCDISLMWLKDLVAGVKFYQTGYAFLISQNGVFVTHPERGLIMRESIFSIAEAKSDPHLRRLGRDMIRGGEGFVPLLDFVSGKKSRLYYAPLPSLGWTLAVIFPEDELFADARRLSTKLILMALLGLGFLALMIIYISRSIARPLKILAEKTSAIGHGDFSVAVPETGSKEIVHLAHSFNQLGQQLTEYMEKRDFIRDTFGRYVTQEVVKRLLESKDALEMGGEIREVTILMSDLRGFTAITADMKPEAVITFLNRYLGKMIEILLDSRAIIDEIIGDGILAFFGAPEPLEDHPARAVACALQMQIAMEEINALNAADGLPHLEMGVSVNTGEVVVGNIGSERRTKYSVVGSHVNFTARIDSYAVGGQVLISSSTYEQIKDLVEVGEIIQAEMKGVSGVVTIYEVQGLKGPYQLRLKERSETLIPLAQKLPIHLYRIKEKVVTGASGAAWITHLSEIAATVAFEGDLEEWEDVRLHLLDDTGQEIPGKIYAKIISVKPGADNLNEAAVRFTSVSPEIYRFIREVAGGA